MVYVEIPRDVILVVGYQDMLESRPGDFRVAYLFGQSDSPPRFRRHLKEIVRY